MVFRLICSNLLTCCRAAIIGAVAVGAVAPGSLVQAAAGLAHAAADQADTADHSGPPSVETLFPAAGQRGTSFQLTLTGSGLQHASEVLLYDDRVKCTAIQAASDNQLVIHLQAAAECPPGACALRVRTPTGLSELRTFRLTVLPVVQEAEGNDSVETAQLLQKNQTVVGNIDAGDADCFRIALKQGDRLSAEVEGIRAGGGMLDAVLNVFDPQGNWILSIDDTAATRQDPFVTFQAAQDGDYVLQVHEVSFQGSEDARYAMHVGDFIRPAIVYPAGGQLGQSVDVTFTDPSGTRLQQTLSLTAAGVEAGNITKNSFGTAQVFVRHDDITSPTPLPFRLSAFGNILEQEPNDQLTDVQSAAELPVALNGILQSAGDIDYFRIRGEASRVVEVEVFADRLGSPVDSLLSVLDSQGQVIASSDDGLTHDSRVTVRFPETADYFVSVTDKRSNGSELHAYRVEISEMQPRLTAFLSRPNRLSQDGQVIAIPRGNRVLTFLGCQRRGVHGPVQLSASQLPAGVMLPATEIPADRYWVPIVVEAAADAPLTGSLAGIEVSANGTDSTGNPISVTGGFRQVVDLVSQSADQLFHAAETDRLAVAVIESVPFRISLSTPATSLAPDGTLDLMVSVQREAGFTGAVAVRFPFLPPWVDGPDAIVIPANADHGLYTVRAFPQATARTWQICAEASVTVDPNSDSSISDGSNESVNALINSVPVASNLVALEIQPSPVTGHLQATAVEQGQPSIMRCYIQTFGALPEPLTAVLEGLPNRVTAREVSVSGRRNSDTGAVPDTPLHNNQQILEFAISPELTAPTGTTEGLVVRIHGMIDGQKVSWCVGRGGQLTIAPVGELMRDETGKPLSRLQALRQQNNK